MVNSKNFTFTLAEGITCADMPKNKCGFAFTLAEALITLGIIGVVAALTVPSLIQNYKEKEIVTKVKKMHSVLSQAYVMYLRENKPEASYPHTKEAAISAAEIFKPYLNILKDCGTVSFKECYGDKDFSYKYKNNNAGGSRDPNLFYTVVLQDGSHLTFRGGVPVGQGNFLFIIHYDVNGREGPNRWGYDLFQFVVTENRVLPVGLVEIGRDTFDTTCAPSSSAGYGCTAWVIHKENMDYLHCDNLSWNGHSKCK